MNSTLFTLVPIIIGIGAVMTLGGIIVVFMGIFRHRNVMQQVSRQMLRAAQQETASEGTLTDSPAAANEYRCSHCGASCGAETEISPSGDFKCQYCNSWSNLK